MELQFHAEGQPKSEAVHLPDLDDSRHTVPTPDSPTGHGVFMHHQVIRKHQHRNTTVLHCYNHNINGLKQDLNTEQLCQAFYKQQIDFGCLQETWLAGDYQRKIKTQHAGKHVSCLLFHHRQPIQKGPHGSGGIASLLGRGRQQAWKNAGSPNPIRSELIDGIKYFIITAYHLDSEYGDDVHINFLNSLVDLYSKAPKDAIIISCDDTNAQLGCNVLVEKEDPTSISSHHKL
eukprot:14357758-Ditylum_brightwellii.AAC.1